MSIVNEITYKKDIPKVIKNLQTIDGLSLKQMIMLNKFMKRFNSFYQEPLDSDLEEHYPLFINCKDEVVVDIDAIRYALKRQSFCQMCRGILITYHIPMLKIIEFYNKNQK